MHIVYQHVNRRNDKSYVGITPIASQITKDDFERMSRVEIDDHAQKLMNLRWIAHCKSARLGSEYVFHRAIRKYGEDEFDHVIIEVCSTLSELFLREIYWIAELHSSIDERGYNMTLGGEGVQMTEALREKHQLAVKAGHSTPEAIERNRAAQKKRFEDHEQRKLISVRTKESMTLDVRRKISASRKGKLPWNKGIPTSQSAIAKMSASKKGKPTKARKAVDQFTLSGKFIARFVSIQHASKLTGVAHSGIGLCARGIYAQSGGFLWRYISA